MEGSPVVLSSLVVAPLGLLQLIDETHYKHLWDEMSANGGMKDLKDFVHQSLLAFKELLTQD